MFSQDNFSYIPIKSKSYSYFYKVNAEDENPQRTIRQCFSVLYDSGVLLYAIYEVLVEKEGYIQDGCYWYYDDIDDTNSGEHCPKVCFEDGFDDPDWAVLITEQENLEYVRKACERFMEIHPEDKYRKLILEMLNNKRNN